ncbi:MAG: hypothetical protein COA79_18510 [Planctomycetota bacterium]|nr:MAG: hypothetical protein COA79_18510 [Planctomycetota bacterium]
MKELIEQLTFTWGLSGININNGASHQSIEQLEENMGYYFPQDFKNYLEEIDGMTSGEADDSLFYFWDHVLIEDELKIAHQMNKNSIYIGFADRIVIDSIYMIEVSRQPQATGKVGVRKNTFKVIAPSFKTFLLEYLNNLEKKLPKWEQTSDEDDDSNIFSLSRILCRFKAVLRDRSLIF